MKERGAAFRIEHAAMLPAEIGNAELDVRIQCREGPQNAVLPAASRAVNEVSTLNAAGVSLRQLANRGNRMTSLASAPPALRTDAELVGRACAADPSAFETIMRRHNRRLFRTARSILRNDAEAEDAVQEAYLRAYQSLAMFRAESSLATWLTRIVINESLARLRRRKREVDAAGHDNVIDLEAQLAMTHSDTQTPEMAAMRAQTRALLERKVDQLPSGFRTVFVLRAIEELTVEETAACLGIPEATVRTRFFRARRLLRNSLSSEVQSTLRDTFAFDGERCDRIVQAVLARVTDGPERLSSPDGYAPLS
jgi:RNA polymerase sigma-70 factor, ECF subfamily